jgi:hypothetical protein
MRRGGLAEDRTGSDSNGGSQGKSQTQRSDIPAQNGERGWGGIHPHISTVSEFERGNRVFGAAEQEKCGFGTQVPNVESVLPQFGELLRAGLGDRLLVLSGLQAASQFL